MKDIKIPKSNSGEQEAITIEKNMVIVGANGAGKTRFGSKLEQINSPTKRILAQRYLQLTEVVQKQDFETAESQLRSVYKNQSPVQPQNDFQQVLMSLFAEESRRNEQVIDDIKSKGNLEEKDLPESVKEQVLKVWNFVFPHRILKLEKNRVRAISESSEFSGIEMSDGEKVGLYLISQILLADKDCILIIDEPELHLHKSLMVRLWNKLEEERRDCLFVYITHDLDFAVSKPVGKIIWIQSFKNNQWEWKELDSNGVIPENLYLEMLGSRKSILFVEGDKGSLDIQIYQAYYENFTVIPCSSCEKVIEAVKGLKNHSDLHDKKVYGLIDKDFRVEEQLDSLKSDGVFSITLNEVENLFLAPEIVEMICKHLSKTDKKDEIIAEIKKIYTENKEKLVFAATKYQRHRHLGEKFGLVKNKNDYDEFKKDIFAELDNLTVIGLPDDTADIIEILKVYPHKGLVNQIQCKIELSKNGYKHLFLSFFATDKRQSMLDILKLYLPEIK